MLFVNFNIFDSFKSKYHEVAEQYKGNDISFLIGDVEASQGAFQVRFLIIGVHIISWLLVLT